MPVSIGFVAEFDHEVGQVRKRIEEALPVLETLMKVETSNAVEDLVYPAYEPTKYGRRMENGGMSDMRNYYTKIDKSKLSVTLENRTRGASDYSDSDGWDPGQISDIIEEGVGYWWKRSQIFQDQPVPRPYTRYAEMKASDDFETGVLIDEYLST